MSNAIKKDSRTGRVIQSGERYRTLYRGQPYECYSLVQPDDDRIHEHVKDRSLIPAIEVMP